MFKCKDDILLLPSYLAFSKEREEKTEAFETTDFIIENEHPAQLHVYQNGKCAKYLASVRKKWQVCEINVKCAKYVNDKYAK